MVLFGVSVSHGECVLQKPHYERGQPRLGTRHPLPPRQVRLHHLPGLFRGPPRPPDPRRVPQVARQQRPQQGVVPVRQQHRLPRRQGLPEREGQVARLRGMRQVVQGAARSRAAHQALSGRRVRQKQLRVRPVPQVVRPEQPPGVAQEAAFELRAEDRAADERPARAVAGRADGERGAGHQRRVRERVLSGRQGEAEGVVGRRLRESRVQR